MPHSIPAFCLLLTACLLPISAVFGHGAYHDQLAEITREFELRPGDAELFRRRALLRVSHEDWQAALVDLEHADRLKPGTAMSDGIRGRALNLAGQWAAALAALESHLKMQPGDAESLFQRARAKHHLGKLDEAAKDYRHALLLMEPVAAERVIEVAEMIHQHEGTNSSLAVLDEALRRLGPDPALLQMTLKLAETAELHERALAAVQSLQAQAPRPEPWMLRRAEILQQAGRADDAKAAWTSLRDHLLALPNLERGTPLLAQIFTETQQALGLAAPAPVIAAPVTPPKP